MKGHLHLTASVDGAGRTWLSAQSFCAPLHLSKPHTDEGALVVNVVNPTAGLFDGDEVDINVQVEAGARLVLTTPSAARVYRARSERPARVCQEIHVAAGGFVEFFPELFIPHGGSRYHQQTQLRVEEGGQMLYCEWLAPGRVARGELFEYEELRWDTDVWHGNLLSARERWRLIPQDASLTGLRTVFPASHYLGFFVLGWPAWPGEALDALTSSNDLYLGHGPLPGVVAGAACPRSSGGGVYLGHGPIPGAAGVVKALCADNLSARRTFCKVRELFHHALGRAAPAVRRF